MIIIVNKDDVRTVRNMCFLRSIFYRLYLKIRRYKYQILKKGDFK